MHDDGALRVTRPARELVNAVTRLSKSMQGLDELTVGCECLEYGGAHVSHDTHRRNNVWRVCDLYSQLGQRRSKGAHTERYYIHGLS